MLLLILATVLATVTAPPTTKPSTSCALYEDSPVGVVCFHSDELTSAIATDGTSWLVEFYSSWCGHCQHFAPTWKKLAQDVSGWSSVVQLGAIDCSTKESYPTCSKYGIRGYPMMRFFHADESFEPTPTLKIYRGAHKVPDIEAAIVDHVESFQGNKPSHWPHFLPIEGSHLLTVLSEEWTPTALIFEENASYVGRMLMLDLLNLKHLKVYRTLPTNHVLVNHYSIMEFPSLVIETRKDDYIVVPGHSQVDARTEFGDAVRRHLQTTPHTVMTVDSQLPSQVDSVNDQHKNTATLVTPFRASRVSPVDVLGAVSYMFRREVPLHSTVAGTAFTTLLRMTHLLENVFTKAYPAAVPSLSLVRQKLEMRLSAGFITSRDWVRLLDSKLNESLFPRKPEWANCRGSQPHYRGYPCSLWTLAHTLTVLTLPVRTGRGEDSNFSPKMTFKSKDALNILSRFIREFFSCDYCREHFAEMSRTLDAGLVVYDGDAVLWLWEAHNIVNRRLANDVTSDPSYPKMPFPSPKRCPYCYQQTVSREQRDVLPHSTPDWDNTGFRSPAESLVARNVTVDRRNLVYAWNRTAVLLYLWNFYHWNLTETITHRETMQAAWPKLFARPRHPYQRPRQDRLGFSGYDVGLCVTCYMLCGALLIIVGYWLIRRRLRHYIHSLIP